MVHRAIEFATRSVGVVKARRVGLDMALGSRVEATSLHHRSWTIRIDRGIQSTTEGIQDSDIRQAS